MFDNLRWSTLGVCLITLLFLVSAGFAGHVQVLTGVGSGVAGQTAFRTGIQLINENEKTVSGQLSVVAGEGMNFEGLAIPRWVGQEGEFTFEGGQGQFSVPPASSLVLILDPKPGLRIGWTRVETDLPIGIESSLEVATLPGKQDPEPLGFDNYLKHQAELLPVHGLKRFSFPIRLFDGLKRIGTAFSVANLAGVAGTVELTYRPDVVKTIQLAPGQMVSDYFDNFWELAFPAVFPLDVRGAAEVSSDVPLGVTVFSTLDAFPISGVPAVEIPVTSECAAGTLEEPFDLAVDQCSVFPEDLSLTFWSIAEDSRCPTDVTCVWEGRIVVELLAQSGTEKQVLQLGLAADRRKASVGNFEIELIDVTPIPISTDPRSIDEYTVRLEVRQRPEEG